MAPTPPDTDPTVVTDGPNWLPGYEFLEEIGGGGSAKVYRARHLRLDRIVAVKVVALDRLDNPPAAARFRAEAVVLARLHHPNVVQVFDSQVYGGRLFIAMELLDGEDLDHRLGRDGPLPEPVAWAVVRQAAAGLAHAAEHGVVHRDVKPANLYLCPPPTGQVLPPGVPLVKVADFGIARTRSGDDRADADRTAHGAVLGTPAFMAPEQHGEAADVDHRADVFALGATAFTALTGRPPFAGPTVWELMEQKLRPRPRFGPGVSAGSAALLARMMAPDPDRRVGRYDELITEIDRLRFARPPADRRPRRRIAWAAAAAGFAGVTAAGLLATRPPVSPARYESAGDHESLFDGVSLAGWQSLGGPWLPATDDEKTPVLEGSGVVRRAFADAADYKVTLGLDVFEATAAEVHFAVPAAGDPTRLVLRVTRAEGAVFGTKAGDKGEFKPLGPPVPFPSASRLRDSRPYLEVRCQRAGGVWSASFHGTEAGRAADDGRPKLPEVRLVAEGGRARVDSAYRTVLRRLPPDGP